MKKLELKVSFTTPAFLGNAKQQGQWRTPPFKALLRQWWRIVWWNRQPVPTINEMRNAEQELFGSAAEEEGVGQSKVRLRLASWSSGSMTNKLSNTKVKHPEVKFPVDAALYLGYGPVAYEKGKGAVLKMSNSIAPASVNELKLQFPAGNQIKDVIQFAAWFGTLGSRSRNGWGSLHFRGDKIESMEALLQGSERFQSLLATVTRPLHDCLRHDWPHAIGLDETGKALIWKSKQSFEKWEEAMKHLAEVKIAFRTALPVHGGFQDRHLLAYPVTHHNVPEWGAQERLANQIHFKVICTNEKLHALVYHLPSDIPQELKHKLGHAPSLSKQYTIWNKVHAELDTRMLRIGGTV